MFIHIVLSICMMFVDIMSGIFQLVFCLVLWCAASQMHFCQLIIYMIFCLNSFVSTLSNLGLLIQNGKFGSYFQGGINTFRILVVIAFFFFYLVAICFAFQAYKEFKGMLYDNGMGMPGGALNGLMAGRASQSVNDTESNNNQQNRNSNYGVNNSANEEDDSSRRGNQSGFRAF